MKTLEQECYIYIMIQELLVPFDTMNWPWNGIFRHSVQKEWRIILGDIAMKCIYFNRKLEATKASLYN